MKKKVFVLAIVAIFCVYNLQAQTRSPKRGVSFNFTNEADLQALQFGTSWFYNWGTSPNNVTSTYYSKYGYEFCPMTWNGNWNSSAIRTYVKANPDCKYILAFNEPNFQNQANLTPAQAAARWPDLKALAQELNLKIISPACNYSGWADWGTPKKWFDAFFQLVPLSDVEGIAIHSYMGWASATAGYVEEYYGYYKKPIWLTEFCHWDNFTQNNGGTALVQRKEMIDLLNDLELNDHCARYAWFIPRRDEVRNPSYPYMELLTNTNGTEKGVLTETGLVWTYMSSYDKDFYHNVNTCIEAEHYISKTKGIYMEQTNDNAGILNVYDFASNRDLVYNVNVPAAGTYTVRLRVLSSAAATVSITSPRGTVSQNITSTANAWADRDFQLDLNAGKQKITFRATAGTLKMNWLVITNNNTFPAPMPNTNGQPPVNVPVTGVTLNKNATTLGVNATEQLTATVNPSNATNKAVNWSSSNTTVATVSNGLITARAVGSATITVTTVDGNRTATCTVTVDNSTTAVTGVALNKNATTLTVGATEQLTATVNPSNATNKNVTWSSNNTTVATVSNGLITARAAGNATITVTTVDGNRTAICAVTVNPATGNDNLALNKPIESSATNDISPASLAVDGNAGTRWESAHGENNKTLTIDLLAIYKLTEIVINWEAAFASSFNIQVSTDKTNWTTVQSNTSGKNGEQKITVNNVNARYVRINCLERATGYGFSIWEIEVYGTAADPKNISAFEQPTILILPNPVEDMLYIWSENQVVKAKIADLNGRKVLEVTDTNTMDLSTCPAGMYILTATLSDGEIVVKKIIKK